MRGAVASVPARGEGGQRLSGLDGLRAIAACSILVFHVWSSDPGTYGPVTLLLPPLRDGVTLFFCLSGFLLYRSFAAAAIRGTRPPSIRRYALRRLLRVAPAYWFVLLATTILLGHGSALGDSGGLSLLGRQALLVANYDPRTLWSGLLPSWTLAIELVFYLVLPLLALASLHLARRCSDRRQRVAAALVPPAALLALGIGGKVVLTIAGGGREDSVEHTWHTVFDASFLTHADLFSCGMVVAVLHVLARDGALHVSARLEAAVTRVLLYLGPLLVVGGFYALPPYVYQPLVALLATLVIAKLVLPAHDSSPGLLLRTLERPTMQFLGVTSYSIFLWNATVTIFLHEHGLMANTGTGPGLLLDIVIASAVTLALSALTYRYVERPFLERRPAPAAAASETSRVRLPRRQLRSRLVG